MKTWTQYLEAVGTPAPAIFMPGLFNGLTNLGPVSVRVVGNILQIQTNRDASNLVLTMPQIQQLKRDFNLTVI
jgi:hypothetical protein